MSHRARRDEHGKDHGVAKDDCHEASKPEHAIDGGGAARRCAVEQIADEDAGEKADDPHRADSQRDDFARQRQVGKDQHLMLDKALIDQPAQIHCDGKDPEHRAPDDERER